MKSNAVTRIVLYSLVALLLLGLLLTGMGIGQFVFHIGSGSGVVVHGGASVDAAGIHSLQIDWVSGNVTVQTGDTDTIRFAESGNFDDDEAMTYSVKNGILRLSAYQSQFQIGFASLPNKDLVITVPQDWVCRDLELDGASIVLDMTGLTLGTLDIDGASCEITFHGAVEILECDGASCEIELICTNRPEEIDLDGASCSLDLTLPAGCGFEVEMDGLDCKFRSDLAYTSRDGEYRYGDGCCRINADGVSCDITIRERK